MDSLSSYRRLAESYPLLTKERELELVRQYQTGTPRQKADALDDLTRSNVRLVMSISRKYAAKGHAAEDLVQEGMKGFRKALDRFDVRRGLRLSTYATYWVRQAMTRWAKGKSRSVYIPEHVVNLVYQLARLDQEFLHKKKRKPTAQEAAVQLMVPVEKIMAARKAARPEVSMQSAVGEDGSELGEFMSDSAERDPGEEADGRHTTAALLSAVRALTPRERCVLRFRYGLSDGRPMTVGEVAALLSVTPERVRAAQERALARLAPGATLAA